MWDGRTRETGALEMILQRVFAFMLVLAAGCMVLVSMLGAAAVAVLADYFRHSVPVPAWALELANFVVSFGLLTLLFLLIYRLVPDLVLPWRTLWTGAAVSALLFVIGKGLLALYFTEAGVGSAYGAAGPIIAIALWIIIPRRFSCSAPSLPICGDAAIRPCRPRPAAPREPPH